MSSFTDPLVLVFLGPKRWRVYSAFSYYVGDETGERIVVPGGFETDGASIPRLLWWLYSPWGSYAKAAVIHDYLYRETCRPRIECDRIFLEAMAVLGVWWGRRHIIYRAVRMFGWLARKGPK